MILVIGKTGTGKSRSLLNLNPKETILLAPNIKHLPWKSSNTLYNKDNKNRFLCEDFNTLKAYIENINEKSPNIKQIVVEDLTHYFIAMQNTTAFINNSSGGGFQKWSTLASDCIQALTVTERKFRPDLKLIVLGHTDRNDNTGELQLQVAGQLLQNKANLVGYTDICLVSDVQIVENKPVYRFITNIDGSLNGAIAKSPEGMLDLYEDNDLQPILVKINNYYN